MKSFISCHFALLFLISGMTVFAREAAQRYKFSAGETNVFAVEISVRSETGSETSSGNVILVTEKATTNSATLCCRGNFKADMKRTPTRMPGFYGGIYSGGLVPNGNVFPPDCKIELDERGHELRDSGDFALAVPLGKLVQSIFEPLPAKSFADEISDEASVLDEPFWIGPAENFFSIRLNGQPMFMGFPRQNPATLMVSRHANWHATANGNDMVELHKHTTLESPLKIENELRLTATSESDLVFDRNAGLFTKIETQSEVSSQTETAARKTKVSFKCRRLTGAELSAVLAPPPPPPPAAPRKLAGADLDKVVADLKSPDGETRRNALRSINGLEIEAPSNELVNLVAAMVADSDTFVRMTAANFLGTYGTTNQVPVLLKLLKDSDWSTRQPAIKALGKLKDERAIQPLADLLARSGTMYGSDVSSALINFGPPAEKAAIGLLNERNAETQRVACTILQQIGTGESLEALQKLVGDSEQSTSQAAVEAIRAIKQRQ